MRGGRPDHLTMMSSDILWASSGALVGWLLYRLAVTSIEERLIPYVLDTWTCREQDDTAASTRLKERIQILEEENQALSERTMSLALENRLLSDRILQVAFVDEEEEEQGDGSLQETSVEDAWSWCWWEEDDENVLYKTPDKMTGIRHDDTTVQTPPLDTDGCVQNHSV